MYGAPYIFDVWPVDRSGLEKKNLRDRENFPYGNPRISKSFVFLKSSGYHREIFHGPGK